MKRILSLCTLLAATLLLRAAAIGTWTAYLAYSEIAEIEKAGETLFVLASDGLFSYNTSDHSVQTYDKATVLSDCVIAHIAWCPSASRLVVVYKNHNIDLLEKSGNVVNISDYYSKAMTESKTVNAINIVGKYAYLATGFGILKVNVERAEISDTYNLGFAVDWVHVDGQRIYAESSAMGQYSALLTSNLLDKSNWTRTANYTAQDKTIPDEWRQQALLANPGGPRYNRVGKMRFVGGKLYTVNNVSEQDACVQVWDGNEWTLYDNSFASSLGHRYVGNYCVDVDPLDHSHVAVGGQTGVYEFRDGQLLHAWTNDNSPLQTAQTVGNQNKDYVVVTNVRYDAQGNLWCLNSISPSTSIVKLSHDGTWSSHHQSKLITNGVKSFEEMRSLMTDSHGLMWFTNDFYRDPSLICYWPQADTVRVYKTFINQDDTQVLVKQVRCVAEDKDQNIWVGTVLGPLMLERSQIAQGGEVFTQVKVPRNDGTTFADYLLADVDITSIVVDGGGRKWFGTNGYGVYLVSADNLTQLSHFTAENSNLLSNTIYDIAIDEQTGEVFIATDKGLCSYMSDASHINDVMTKDNVYAYPNPVRPDYTGPITITGLSYDADVKIVTANGALVTSGRSNGGSFVWDGCDSQGRRVASGVYMVMTATREGEKGTVCKVAIIN